MSRTGVSRASAYVLMVLALATTPLSACSDSAEDPSPEVAAEIESALDEVLASQSTYDQVRAVVVMQGGEVLVERYYDSEPEDFWPTQSVTKSVVGTLVGIAVDDGLLALDDTLGDLLPAYTRAMSPQVRDVTVEQVLTQTAGFTAELVEERENRRFVRAADSVAFALRHSDGPQSDFAYSSAGPHVLAAALQQVTGRPLLDYAREVLFDPLGIVTEPSTEVVARARNLSAYYEAAFVWPVDRQGHHLGWGFLKLRTADMAKLGQLYLDGGTWEGERVVSEAWVESATSAHVRADGIGPGYGYLWWIEEVDGQPLPTAWGYGGQLIAVVPQLDAVVAVSVELHLDQPPSRDTLGIGEDTAMALIESAVFSHLDAP